MSRREPSPTTAPAGLQGQAQEPRPDHQAGTDDREPPRGEDGEAWLLGTHASPYHADKGGATETMQRLNAACEILQ